MKRLIVVCACMVCSFGMAFAGGAQEGAVKKESGDGGYIYEVGDITVECKLSADSLELTLSAPTNGWIAVGFEPSSVMKDANIIIGAVEGGSVRVEDHFGVSTFGHEPDTNMGGTKDVEVLSGSESGGETSFSFTMPLDSGDDYDTPLSAGDKVKVILAYGKDDNFGKKHSYRASAELTLE